MSKAFEKAFAAEAGKRKTRRLYRPMREIRREQALEDADYCREMERQHDGPKITALRDKLQKILDLVKYTSRLAERDFMVKKIQGIIERK